MVLNYWGASPFVTPRMLNRVSKANRWSWRKLKSWYLVSPATEGLWAVARPQSELVPLAQALEMPLEEFIGRLEEFLRKGRTVRGIQCQDGILVHPGALGECVKRMVRKDRTLKSLRKTLEGL